MAKVTALQVLEDAQNLKLKKMKDYQGDVWSEEDYFPYGDKSFIHMIWTKVLRIRSVAEKDTTNFESLEDSLLDLINYGAMYCAWLENQRLESEERKIEPSIIKNTTECKELSSDDTKPSEDATSVDTENAQLLSTSITKKGIRNLIKRAESMHPGLDKESWQKYKSALYSALTATRKEAFEKTTMTTDDLFEKQLKAILEEHNKSPSSIANMGIN